MLSVKDLIIQAEAITVFTASDVQISVRILTWKIDWWRWRMRLNQVEAPLCQVWHESGAPTLAGTSDVSGVGSNLHQYERIVEDVWCKVFWFDYLWKAVLKYFEELSLCQLALKWTAVAFMEAHHLSRCSASWDAWCSLHPTRSSMSECRAVHGLPLPRMPRTLPWMMVFSSPSCLMVWPKNLSFCW